ncbi:FkbM family methyltransferase [Lacibacter sp. H375]|uniref:FkbM family methyltransferase n=1 Tax=Lacibacter sp. H375 TaxID=3133424 RepID=UPI0030BE6EFF
MKQSLRKAVALFNFSDQLYIYIAVFCFKIKRQAPAKAAALFQNCNEYVRLIEHGVSFVNCSNDLVKASLTINQQHTTVFLRKHSSDLQVFESVIQHGEYKIVTEKVKNCNIIVDAGGNIGLTTVYLHAYYPNARFVIIEPDKNNFSLLQKNLEHNNIGNVKLFNKALWVSNEKLMISHSFRDGKEWSLTVEKANGAPQNGNDFLEGISLKEICATSSIEMIDLLKIDIEGAERFLYQSDDFLQAIEHCSRNLVIEIHDEFNIREMINHTMRNIGFSATEAGDITLFVRK